MVYECVGYVIPVNREERSKCTGVGKTLDTILRQTQTNYCHSHRATWDMFSHVSRIIVEKHAINTNN